MPESIDLVVLLADVRVNAHMMRQKSSLDRSHKICRPQIKSAKSSQSEGATCKRGARRVVLNSNACARVPRPMKMDRPPKVNFRVYITISENQHGVAGRW